MAKKGRKAVKDTRYIWLGDIRQTCPRVSVKKLEVWDNLLFKQCASIYPIWHQKYAKNNVYHVKRQIMKSQDELFVLSKLWAVWNNPGLRLPGVHNHPRELFRASLVKAETRHKLAGNLHADTRGGVDGGISMEE